MKKIIAIIAVCLLFTGCSKKIEENDEPSGLTGIANPMVSYESLSEINNKVNGKLAAVENAQDESYIVISDEIAEYNFTLEGLNYTVRCTKDMNKDISGYYLNGKLAFEESHDEYAITGDDEYKICRFFTEDCQYVIMVKDANTMDDNAFDRFCKEYVNSVK